ncbi:MAG TPA: deoxyribonuclease IV [Verrucomicrobiae bacterium]|nr:deoxyribonuclease IV [Verrucomicrobiae bacterium]
MRLGIHLYTFGSLSGAAARAVEIRADTLQIFTASPRMWRSRPPDPAEVAGLKAIRRRFDIRPLVVHVNYLVNLASADETIRQRSILTLRGEFERAASIGAEYLVVHPGSAKGRGIEEAIAAIAEGIGESARGSTGVSLLLENTAGCGSSVGSRFEELRAIREAASSISDAPIGYCLDTCHLLAAGFDITTPAGLRDTLRQAEATLGLEHVRVIHANDSKTPLGSRVDRHARIGQGHIGLEPFRRLLALRELRRMTFISETPVERDGDERRNMRRLRSLAPVNSTKARAISRADARVC